MPPLDHPPRRLSRGRYEASRPGFTLFELLVVLSLIAAAVAISMPYVVRLADGQRLKQSAETVRIKLTSTRVHAIEQGLPYQFRFEPDGQNYCILPGDGLNPVVAPTGGGTVRLPMIAGKLTGNCKFEKLPMGRTGGGMIPETQLSAFPNAHDLAVVNWSPPIVFYSDGATEDVQIILMDPKSARTMEVALRGLTGGTLVTAGN